MIRIIGSKRQLAVPQFITTPDLKTYGALRHCKHQDQMPVLSSIVYCAPVAMGYVTSTTLMLEACQKINKKWVN